MGATLGHALLNIPQAKAPIPLPDGNEQEESEPTTPTLEISDTDIVQILEKCEQENLQLTQQVGGNTASGSYVSKQLVQQTQINSPKSLQQLHNIREYY